MTMNPPTTAAIVLGHITAHAATGPVSRRTLIRLFQLQERRADEVLAALIASGQIKRVARGLFAIPGGADRVPAGEPISRVQLRQQTEAARVDLAVLRREIAANLDEALEVALGAGAIRDAAAWMPEEQPLDRLMGILRTLGGHLQRRRT